MDTDEKTSLCTLEISSLLLRTQRHSSRPCDGVLRGGKTLLTLLAAFSRESSSGCDPVNTTNASKHFINQSEERILQIDQASKHL